MYTREDGVVVFSYSNSEMLQEFLEKGVGLVPAVIQEGELGIEGKDELFPFVNERDEASLLTIKRLFAIGVTPLYFSLRELLPFSSSGSSDIESDIEFEIRDSANYQTSDIEFLDTSIRSIIIDQALLEWFKTKDIQSITEKATRMVNDEMQLSAPIIRRMIQSYHRRSVSGVFSHSYLQNMAED